MYMDQQYVCSITPTEFEKYCLEILSGYAEEEKLKNFKITHNVKIPVEDGTYQIDVYASFTAMGVEFKVLCECKQYSSPVGREKVVILNDKLKSLGAQKGIPLLVELGMIKPLITSIKLRLSVNTSMANK